MTHDIRTTGLNASRLAACFSVVLLHLFGVGLGWARASERGNDVTQYVEKLGNPFSKTTALDLRTLYRLLARGKYRRGERIYARNIWDMHVYDGRLYLGAGNSSDRGPAQNAGPVPIICYDPIKEKFLNEGTVQDEQIDVYYTYRGRLFIPGHDPIQSWKLGNFYRRQDNGRWKKYRNVPDAIHMYAVAWHKGKLFGSLGTPPAKGGAAVCISSDDGKTWTVVQTGSYRVYNFLLVADELYATEAIRTRNDAGRSGFCVSHFKPPDRFLPRRDITAEILFPQTCLRPGRRMKVVRVGNLKDKALYIGAYCHNDHQFLPFGLFLASSLDKENTRLRRVELPDGTRPWDWVARDGHIYVLLEAKATDRVRVKVLRYRVEDLRACEEVLCFDAPTFARSFEILDGDFYFGLGCEVDNPRNWKQEELHPATGEILRVKAEFVKSPRLAVNPAIDG